MNQDEILREFHNLCVSQAVRVEGPPKLPVSPGHAKIEVRMLQRSGGYDAVLPSDMSELAWHMLMLAAAEISAGMEYLAVQTVDRWHN